MATAMTEGFTNLARALRDNPGYQVTWIRPGFVLAKNVYHLPGRAAWLVVCEHGSTHTAIRRGPALDTDAGGIGRDRASWCAACKEATQR
jgi:hypothetical protein